MSKVLMALALAGSIGAHWAFLQSLAWAGMVVTYSQDAPVSVAIAKTFDGEHPCCICEQIARDKKADKKADVKTDINKLDFRYAATAYNFHPPSFYWETFPRNDIAPFLNQVPPLPPPRVFIG
jgi:hypothetical protein